MVFLVHGDRVTWRTEYMIMACRDEETASERADALREAGYSNVRVERDESLSWDDVKNWT